MNVLIWYIMLALLGAGFMPLTGFIFRNFRDRGWLFSKAVGMFLTVFVFWCLNTARIIRFTQTSCLIVGVALIALNLAAARFLKTDSLTESADVRLIVIEEAAFAVLFFAWVWMIGYKPAAYGTEKFMDYGFITAALRSPYMPFADTWYGGEPINYYYGGQFIAAFLVRFSGVTAGEGYTLMRATITAFSAMLPFSLVYQLLFDRFLEPMPAWLGGVLGALGTAFCGNGHYVIYGIIKPIIAQFAGADYSYWFPNSTRYIGFDPDLPDKTIHEYPAYSPVLGDLHAHYINIIFVVAVTGIPYTYMQRLTKENGRRRGIVLEILSPEIVLIGIFTGVFRWTNFWDFPIYFVVCGAMVFFMNLRRSGKDYKDFLILMGGQALAAFLFGTLAALPFTLSFDMISSEIAPTHSHTMVYQFLIVWGLPIFIFLVYGASLLTEKQKMKTPDLAVLLMGLCALGLIFMPEVIYVKDIYSGEHYRANTMFKLTYQAFILFGMMMGYVVVRTLRMKEGLIRGLGLAGGFLLLMTAGYTPKSVQSWFGNVLDPAGRVNTDASVFVDESFPEDFGAISWLNLNVRDQSVVLEAPGDSYTGYERVSVATGLPTVLGWYVHEWLWRNDVAALNERAADIEKIYTSSDANEVSGLIKKYNISYIYIGKLEREKYPALNDKLLQTMGKVAYSDGVTTYIMKVQ
ncbi:MAG: hypothetical protein IKF75_00715 [Lachnospiraceae bacterium]|nr:hypothetical protein [Lachnospiraceae bacterium]